MFKQVLKIFVVLLQYRKILFSTTIYELKKKYAGSILGYSWLVLFPMLFLSVYLFLWLVVFKVRFPGYSELDYVVFVFSGLVPFLFLSESVQMATVVIKQNMHLIKNVIMPIDLIPVRVMCVAAVMLLVGLAILLLLSIFNNNLSWKIFLLIFVVGFNVLFILGLSFILAPLGVLVPDTVSVTNILIMLLMFLSPIAFKPDLVPTSLKYVLLFNPITYIIDAYRFVIISSSSINFFNLSVFIVMSVFIFILGVNFFYRFKGYMVDYE